MPPGARSIARAGVLASLGAGAVAGVASSALAHGLRRAWKDMDYAWMEIMRGLRSGGYEMDLCQGDTDLFRFRYTVSPDALNKLQQVILRHTDRPVSKTLREVLGNVIQSATTVHIIRPQRLHPLPNTVRTVCLVTGAGLAITLLAVGAYLLWHRAGSRRKARAHEELMGAIREYLVLDRRSSTRGHVLPPMATAQPANVGESPGATSPATTFDTTQ